MADESLTVFGLDRADEWGCDGTLILAIPVFSV